MKNVHTERRRFLSVVGGAAVGSSVLATAAAAKNPGQGGGFPPKGITEWSSPRSLGDGEIRTFASTTPSGKPKYVGLHFSDGAMTNLPTPTELEEGDGTELHGGFMSKLYAIPFPSSAPAPFEFMGFGWNSEGHLPRGVYSKPHFDVHFYFRPPEEILEIGPRNPAPNTPPPITDEDVADGQIPDGYRLIEGGNVIPNMGAHMAPTGAPEFENPDDASDWLKTLIWGAADTDEDDVFELNFVEPMVTVDFFRNHLDGVHREGIAQPEQYPTDGWYPTTYALRDLGDGGYAAVMEGFEERSE
ncbi:hypothetical protein [Halolamina sp. C58]|uniref:hypothetical protein n=1 Tax=Halolamina sp. C58 TaxID=3421640 RepID=UPI003EBAC427